MFADISSGARILFEVTLQVRRERGAAVLLVLVAGCGVELVPLLCREDSSSPLCPTAGGDLASTPAQGRNGDGGTSGSPGTTWGAYAAGLDVPSCSMGPVLVVNTVDDESDGPDGGTALSDVVSAGPRLSFREAMTIAANRPGPDIILFDPEVFPVDGAATIHLSTRPFPNVGPVCIDGRNRGVTLDWPPGLVEATCPQCVWRLTEASLQVGLTLRQMPDRQVLAGGQLAGTRLSADYVAVETYYGTFGPGNAVGGPVGASGGPSWGVIRGQLVTETKATIIRDSFFGYDPVADEVIPLTRGIVLFEGAEVVGNVFASNAIDLELVQSGPASIHHNHFGVGAKEDPKSSAIVSVQFNNPRDATFGPDNVVRGRKEGVRVLYPTASVRITQNVITSNDVGIRWAEPEPPRPSLLAISLDGATAASVVRGTCPVDGTVEVFTDPGDQGERYVGTVACTTTAEWTIALPLPTPHGLNATATLTAGGRTSAFAPPIAIP